MSGPPYLIVRIIGPGNLGGVAEVWIQLIRVVEVWVDAVTAWREDWKGLRVLTRGWGLMRV